MAPSGEQSRLTSADEARTVVGQAAGGASGSSSEIFSYITSGLNELYRASQDPNSPMYLTARNLGHLLLGQPLEVHDNGQ